MANNAVIFSGNLTKDPELKKLSGGKAVLNFRVAVDAAGNNQESAGFFDCAAWGDLAENLGSSLSKGQRVVVIGQLKHRTFEVKGDARSTVEVLVEDAGPSLLWMTAELTNTKKAKAA